MTTPNGKGNRRTLSQFAREHNRHRPVNIHSSTRQDNSETSSATTKTESAPSHKQATLSGELLIWSPNDAPVTSVIDSVSLSSQSSSHTDDEINPIACRDDTDVSQTRFYELSQPIADGGTPHGIITATETYNDPIKISLEFDPTRLESLYNLCAIGHAVNSVNVNLQPLELHPRYSHRTRAFRIDETRAAALGIQPTTIDDPCSASREAAANLQRVIESNHHAVEFAWRQATTRLTTGANPPQESIPTTILEDVGIPRDILDQPPSHPPTPWDTHPLDTTAVTIHPQSGAEPFHLSGFVDRAHLEQYLLNCGYPALHTDTRSPIRNPSLQQCFGSVSREILKHDPVRDILASPRIIDQLNQPVTPRSPVTMDEFSSESLETQTTPLTVTYYATAPCLTSVYNQITTTRVLDATDANITIDHEILECQPTPNSRLEESHASELGAASELVIETPAESSRLAEVLQHVHEQSGYALAYSLAAHFGILTHDADPTNPAFHRTIAQKLGLPDTINDSQPHGTPQPWSLIPFSQPAVEIHHDPSDTLIYTGEGLIEQNKLKTALTSADIQIHPEPGNPSVRRYLPQDLLWVLRARQPLQYHSLSKAMGATDD